MDFSSILDEIKETSNLKDQLKEKFSKINEINETSDIIIQKIHLQSDEKGFNFFLKTSWPPTEGELTEFIKFRDPQIRYSQKIITVMPAYPSHKDITSPRAIYSTYCLQCHYTQGVGGEIKFDRIKSFVGTANSKRTALDLMRMGIMPPLDALQRNSLERKIFLDYLIAP